MSDRAAREVIAAGSRDTITPRARAIALATAAWSISIVAALGAITLRIVDPAPVLADPLGFGDIALVGFEVLGVAFATVGAVLVSRLPRNMVGWCMVLTGATHALAGLTAAATFSAAVASTSDGRQVSQVLAWLGVLFTISGAEGIAALFFIFPTGRGHTTRWDRFARSVALFGLAVLAVFLFQPGPLQILPGIENPFGFLPDARPILGTQLGKPILGASYLLAPIGAWALVSRYRVASAIERQQLKWFGLALAVTVGGLSLSAVWSAGGDRPPEFGLVVFGFAGALVPIAIGIAITRYHLYDIDRIISRTLTYAVVSALLFALFAMVNLGLQWTLGGLTGNQPALVAASTLAVAAAFNPVRTRVQGIIDRRFNRARFDAERTVAGFADRLRDEVDLPTLVGELSRAATHTVEPSSAGIWLRARQAAG
jgi:hypothetical protein